jgi:hypothetical protein
MRSTKQLKRFFYFSCELQTLHTRATCNFQYDQISMRLRCVLQLRNGNDDSFPIQSHHKSRGLRNTKDRNENGLFASEFAMLMLTFGRSGFTVAGQTRAGKQMSTVQPQPLALSLRQNGQ